jgi:hypothetical protein
MSDLGFIVLLGTTFILAIETLTDNEKPFLSLSLSTTGTKCNFLITDVALYIKDPEADRLARELASVTGETLTEAVLKAARSTAAKAPQLPEARKKS